MPMYDYYKIELLFILKMKNIYSHRKLGLIFQFNKASRPAFYSFNQLISTRCRLFSVANYESLQSEELLTELKEKPLTTDQIYDMINSKKIKFVPQHYNVLLLKTNRIYEDMLIRVHRATTQGEAYQETKIVGNIPVHSSFIFRTALADVSKVIDTVSKADLTTWLSILGKTKIKFDLDHDVVSILENKVINSIQDFPLSDLMTLACNFMNLNYTPFKIIEKINEEEKFVIVPSNILKELLQSLVKNKFIKATNLYVKIFEQLKLSSINMEGNEMCQIFDIIKEIYDLGVFSTDENLKAVFYDDIIKFFSNKLIELQKRKIEPNNSHLISLLKTFEVMNISNYDVEDLIVTIMATRTSNSLPAVVESMTYLKDECKKKLIEITIAHLKDKKADIRHLKFNDLFLFMIEVIKYSEKDISHFFKYLEKIFQNEVEEKFDINISSDLFYCAVQNGYITKSSISQFLYHYLFQLCEQHDKLDADKIPGILWAMAYIEEKDLPNPLIPILLEKLSKLKLSKPMSEIEAAQLYQLIMFVDDKVENVKYPPEYKDIFSEAVRKASKKAYLSQDVCHDKDIQNEIGNYLNYSLQSCG